MNDHLLDLIHLRKSLYRQLRKSAFQDQQLLLNFRSVRRQTNNMYRQLRNKYYLSACQMYSRDPKKLWSVINEVTGRMAHRIPVPIPPQELNKFFSVHCARREPQLHFSVWTMAV